MPNKKYNILYSGDTHQDTISLLTYMDQFAETLKFERFDIDYPTCQGILSAIKQNFPHKEGLDKASPFKKISNFVTTFIVSSPIKSQFPDSFIIDGYKLNEIRNHQNAILAYHIAVDSLENATIYKNDKPTILKNRIQASSHTYIDIIDTLSDVQPLHHFKIVTLLFEQLSYRFNPDASYKLAI